MKKKASNKNILHRKYNSFKSVTTNQQTNRKHAVVLPHARLALCSWLWPHLITCCSDSNSKKIRFVWDCIIKFEVRKAWSIGLLNILYCRQQTLGRMKERTMWPGDHGMLICTAALLYSNEKDKASQGINLLSVEQSSDKGPIWLATTQIHQMFFVKHQTTEHMLIRLCKNPLKRLPIECIYFLPGETDVVSFPVWQSCIKCFWPFTQQHMKRPLVQEKWDKIWICVTYYCHVTSLIQLINTILLFSLSPPLSLSLSLFYIWYVKPVDHDTVTGRQSWTVMRNKDSSRMWGWLSKHHKSALNCNPYMKDTVCNVIT